MSINDCCPYCLQKMEAGVVMAGRGPIKWYPDAGASVLGLINLDAKRVGQYGFLQRSKLVGFRCRQCDILIVRE